MQEEVEQKTVALVISAGKLTGRELKKAIPELEEGEAEGNEVAESEGKQRGK